MSSEFLRMIEDLNENFSTNLRIHLIRDPIIGVILEVDSQIFRASIAQYGGQVLSWSPKRSPQEVLWSPRKKNYQKGRALRGGVPICWPWFGANHVDKKMPSHGYARLAEWEFISIKLLESGDLIVTMKLFEVPEQFNIFHKNLRLSQVITIGETFSIEIFTENVSFTDQLITEGFHTYFNISDINNISVDGLDASEYLDLVLSTKGTQSGPIRFFEEFGRIYINSTNHCIINDVGFKRKILIEKQGSESTAVWNPWSKKASEMDDLGPHDWRNMICVETANALQNLVRLSPQTVHSMRATYSVMQLDIEPHQKDL